MSQILCLGIIGRELTKILGLEILIIIGQNINSSIFFSTINQRHFPRLTQASLMRKKAKKSYSGKFENFESDTHKPTHTQRLRWLHRSKTHRGEGGSKNSYHQMAVDSKILWVLIFFICLTERETPTRIVSHTHTHTDTLRRTQWHTNTWTYVQTQGHSNKR